MNDPTDRLTYTELRDFLDGYTNDDGVIQGDPAIIASEAALRGFVWKDDAYFEQHGLGAEAPANG